MCATVITTRTIVLRSVPIPARGSVRMGGGMKGRGVKKKTHRGRDGVCVCEGEERGSPYLHGKSSYLLFEVGSISVLRKHTEEGAVDSVCVQACECVYSTGEKNRAGGAKIKH